LQQSGLPLLAWRDVPVDNSGLGDKGAQTEPDIRQLLIGRPQGLGDTDFAPPLHLARCLAETASGIEQGFIGLDSTLNSFRQTYWHSQLFTREMLSTWRSADGGDISQAASDQVRRIVSNHDFALDSDIQIEIDAILNRAKCDLDGGRP